VPLDLRGPPKKGSFPTVLIKTKKSKIYKRNSSIIIHMNYFQIARKDAYNYLRHKDTTGNTLIYGIDKVDSNIRPIVRKINEFYSVDQDFKPGDAYTWGESCGGHVFEIDPTTYSVKHYIALTIGIDNNSRLQPMIEEIKRCVEGKHVYIKGSVIESENKIYREGKHVYSHPIYSIFLDCDKTFPDRESAEKVQAERDSIWKSVEKIVDRYLGKSNN
jgi:hypothetical protein